ncbi:RDD family protein [Paenibacillus sp. sptzw28]|nr:RDD family protein [Paenibacillus sp. sptzw28]
MERPAGFWVRLAANLLDAFIVSLPLSIISYFIAGDWEGDYFTTAIEFLYGIFLPVLWSGYTIGKRTVGIRIAKVNGEKVGIGTMLLRILLGALVYVLTVGIGIIVSAFMVGLRDDKRAIHDFIAGTYVRYN